MIPVKEGLWTSPPSATQQQLLANRCPSCGEIFFPKKSICINCQQRNLDDIRLSRRGKIYSYTVVMQQPGIWYKGPVPYAIGYVELPEGVRIETLLKGENLKIGMEVELVIEKLYEDDEGSVIMAYKFQPVEQ